MTLSKQALSETLDYYDANDQAFVISHIPTYIAAARFTERLLPELKEGDGTYGVGPEDVVWDEGLVEVVAVALYKIKTRVGTVGGWYDHDEKDSARAVLAALAGEVGR